MISSQHGGYYLGLDFCEEIPSPSWRSGVLNYGDTFHDLHTRGFYDGTTIPECWKRRYYDIILKQHRKGDEQVVKETTLYQ